MRSRPHVLTSSVIAGIILPSLYFGATSAATAPKPEAPTRTSQEGADHATKDDSCLKCHKAFAAETLSRQHLRVGVDCVDCHGPSIAHTQAGPDLLKPDILLGRTEVEPFCQRCHDAAHAHPDKVDAWARERTGQLLPTGRAIMEHNICTDCHGQHIEKQLTSAATRPAPLGEPVSLFNGRDLTGWVSEGQATWKVEDGLLVGTQGPDYAAGDLFTAESYSDFDLLVTYRVVWPANSGIWFRYQNPRVAYQADILEYPKPEAYSGTIYCPGRLFLAINPDKGLVNREGWNTLRIRAFGDLLQVWLNGIKVAETRDSAIQSGKIGFQVHPGKELAPMKILIRQALIQRL